MKIGFIGVGKLGMPCALGINMKGHDVLCYDVVKECMQKDVFPHREIGPNGEKSIEPLLQNSSLKFGSIEDIVKETEIIFVAVQTPHSEKYEGITRIPDERVDFEYKYLIECIKKLSECVDKNGEDKIVIIISTVLPGTIRKHILPIMTNKIKLCYNPYFIAMGTTMQDFYNPEFVLFGVHDDNAAKKAEEFYKTIHDRPFYKTTIESAELIKVAYNTFISSKIAIVNTLMEICHHIHGADVDDITNALKIATDRIISTKYLTAGMGDGGGCHPRDNIALSWLSNELGLSYNWFDGIMRARENQTAWLADLIAKEFDKGNKKVIILGKAFKPETNLTVGSPSILLKNILLEKGINAEMYDPYIDEHKFDTSKQRAIYFIGTKHNDFVNYKFASGSTVIDPHRYIKNQKDIKVIRIGEGKYEI